MSNSFSDESPLATHDSIVTLRRRSPESMASYSIQQAAILNARVLALEKLVGELRERIVVLEKQHA